MKVRRGVVAGLVGLALVVGASGCGKIGEKVAEEAIERNSDCENIDINADEGAVSGSCAGEDFDANASGNADLPDDWPTDLAPPEGFKIVTSTASDTPIRTLNVVGSLDGDVTEVYEGIKAQLTAAGYTIDTDSLADAGNGPAGTMAATGADFTAAVTVSESVNALEGNVTVTYTLNAAGGS